MNCKSLLPSAIVAVTIVLATPPARGADFFIDVDINGFHPSTEFITVGDRVTWIAQDDNTHDISSDKGAWSTGFLFMTGDTFTLRFNQAGSFGYHSVLDGSIGNIIVTSAVASNAPPSVTITNPVAGAVLDSPATVSIGASATDDGGIRTVEFFAGTNSLGVSSSPPYSVTTNLSAGNYTLTAIATDNTGLTSISAPVGIVVRHVVTYQNFSFTPSSLTINPGETVLFTNRGGFHNVTGTGSEPYCGGGTTSASSCVVTLNTPGTFPYKCGIHPTMTGSITVAGPPHDPITMRAPTLSGGQFGFSIDGFVAGKTNLIQFSTSLATWTSMATNVASGSSFQFTDPDAATGSRFYRVLELP